MLKLVSLRAEKKQFASLVVAQRMERRAAISRMLCAEGRQTCNVRSTSDSAAVNAQPSLGGHARWLRDRRMASDVFQLAERWTRPMAARLADGF